MNNDELQEYEKEITSNENVLITPPSNNENKILSNQIETSIEQKNDIPITAEVENTNIIENTERQTPYQYIAKNNTKAPEFNEVDTTKVSDLIELYVGNKYSKFANTSFNIWAFIFGGIYFFYRKMILYGLIEILALVICSTCIESELSYLIPFLINALGAFLVNDLYLSYSRNKIQNIINKNENPDIRIMKCMKKGGSSIGHIILGILITILISLILAFSIGIDKVKKELNLNFGFNFNIKNDKEEPTEETFNGMIIRNDSFKYDTIFNISEGKTFKKDTSFTKGLSLVKKENDNKICEINLYEIANYKNIDTLSYQMAQFYYKKDPIKIEKNNISWYEFDGTFGISYSDIYLTSKNTKIYELILSIQDNAYKTECKTEFINIVESISFK